MRSTLSKFIGASLAIGAICALTACSPAGGASATASPSEILPPGNEVSAAPGDGPTTAAPLPTQQAPLGETVTFDTGISVAVASLTAVEVEAQTPGEVSGPAVVATVTVTNGSHGAQNLDSAVVMLAADSGDPGIGTTAGEPEPFGGSLEPGATATGRYVFMLDPAAGRAVSVSLNYAAGAPVAVFTGKVSS
ncbi:MAG: hypothetical protein J7484_01840 [Microbacterium sp.]|nr:hypothetical protein [Microbacterium sp.]